MKISKLFHWLYALVMLLPIFAIGVTCGYAMFNKNAFKSKEYTGVTSSLIIDNSNQFVSDTEYTIEYVNNEISSNSLEYHFTTSTIPYNELDLPNLTYNGFQFVGANGILFLNVENQFVFKQNIWGNELTSFNAVLTSFTNTFTNFKIIKYNYTSYTLDNVFYYSIDKVTNSNLFNWAYDSFLVVPFTYIVNLFSMPTNSPIVMLLSYWLAISIIWLVFDLVMYIPLLVHRWLDKGVIE